MTEQTERHFRLRVSGMTCDSCNLHVQHAMAGIGLQDVHADWRRGEAAFTIPPGREAPPLARLDGALRDAGYGAVSVEPAGSVSAPAAPASDRAGGEHDLLIVGSGSAAFAAAIRARELGARVAMVERGTLGGTCVNVGCVPSKALLKAAELHWEAGHHAFAGIHTRARRPDLGTLVEQKDGLVEELRRDRYEAVAAAYGWDVIRGEARFVDETTLDVGGSRFRPGSVLIATGAQPWAPPIPGLRDAGYLTSTSALELRRIPRRLAVIGGNAIGLELGQLFLHLGSEVTVLEALPRIAPFDEPEVSAALADALRQRGMALRAGLTVEAVGRRGRERVVRITERGGQSELLVDAVLVATGRRPDAGRLAPERAGVALDERGFVRVDAALRSSNPRVWAAGDVTGAPQFVYFAAYEGTLAADNALGRSGRSVDLTGLPRVTFTSPQAAAVGLTEAEARDQGYGVRTTVLPMALVPRAIVNHHPEGLVKLVVEDGSGRLLGMHAVAEAAGEMIQVGVLAIRHGIIVAELATDFFPYLTEVEAAKLAAQSLGRDVALLSCCAG